MPARRAFACSTFSSYAGTTRHLPRYEVSGLFSSYEKNALSMSRPMKRVIAIAIAFMISSVYQLERSKIEPEMTHSAAKR